MAAAPEHIGGKEASGPCIRASHSVMVAGALIHDKCACHIEYANSVYMSKEMCASIYIDRDVHCLQCKCARERPKSSSTCSVFLVSQIGDS